MYTALSDMNGIAAYLAPKPLVTVLGVKYLHLRVNDGTDVYVTEYGLPFTQCLMPENHWADDAWMKRHSVRLPGTSALFHVRTKEVGGHSRDIVVKWNRMGQDIPGETLRLRGERGVQQSLPGVQPGARNAPHAPGIARPLVHAQAAGHLRAAQVRQGRTAGAATPQNGGDPAKPRRRDSHRLEPELCRHLRVAERHRCRTGLPPGIGGQGRDGTAGQSCPGGSATQGLCRQRQQTSAHHRAPDGGQATGEESIGPDAVWAGRLRTPQADLPTRRATARRKRQDYLIRQAHRFEPRQEFPEELTPVSILGVNYVYGQVESTGGALWVVGRDPMLFDYFLPEKWRRTPRTRISASQQVFETVTKDNIHLVWRVSRVGQIPDADPFVRRERQILDYGYNSPFEEFSIAMELSRRGIETTYPRAIYMTGHRSSVSSSLVDNSRYDSHATLRTPDDHALLSRQHEYVTIWGYWNGPDETLAVKDEVVYRGIDALAAYRDGRLTQREYVRVVRTARRRMIAAGVEDLSLRGNHMLLSIDREQKLAVDDKNLPLIRICNFELLRKIQQTIEHQ